MESEEPVHRLADSILPRRASRKRSGRPQAKAQGLSFDIAFTSVLTRAQHTLDLMLEEIGPDGHYRCIKDQALNERDYGDLSGLNKDDARKKWGEEQVLIWRRSYDVRAARRRKPEGHRSRARCPITCRKSCRACCAASDVLVAAHGNSLRALVMVLEKLTPEADL